MSPALSTSELADRLNCSVSTIRRLVRKGDLPAFRLTPGSPMRFAEYAVEHIEGETMDIRQVKRVGWCADFWFVHPDGRRERVRKKSPVQTRRGAEKYAAELRRRMLDGSYNPMAQRTFKDYAERFKTWLELQELEPSTRKSYLQILRIHLIPYFGRRSLISIDREAIDQFRAKSKGSRKSVNNYLGVLSRVLTLAVDDGILAARPRIKMWKQRKLQKEYRWLSKDVAQELLDVCGDRLGAMVTVALNTGLRLGELQALRWRDVDIDRERITVRRSYCAVSKSMKTPKNDKPRTVPLNEEAIAALRDHPKRIRCALVFSTSSGKVVDKPDLSRELRRACDLADMEPIGWHVLRHTFASWLVQQGVSLYVVQNLLGHSSVTMTMRYAHLCPDVGQAAVRLLSAQK